MTENQYFIIYVILWAIVWGISGILEKRAKDVLTKRRIGIVSGIIIICLMALLTLALGMSLIFLPIFLVAGIAFVFFGDSQTQFCQNCGKRISIPFEKINFCPKCGAEIKDLLEKGK